MHSGTLQSSLVVCRIFFLANRVGVVANPAHYLAVDVDDALDVDDAHAEQTRAALDGSDVHPGTLQSLSYVSCTLLPREFLRGPKIFFVERPI